MRGKLWCMTQSSDPSWQLYWVSVSHCVLTRKTFQPCHEQEKKIDGAECKLSYQYNDIYIYMKKKPVAVEKKTFLVMVGVMGASAEKIISQEQKQKNLKSQTSQWTSAVKTQWTVLHLAKEAGRHTHRDWRGSPAASGRADGRICNKCTEQHNRLRTPCGLKKNHCHRDRHYGASDVKVDADVDYNNAIKSFGSDGFVYKTHFHTLISFENVPITASPFPRCSKTKWFFFFFALHFICACVLSGALCFGVHQTEDVGSLLDGPLSQRAGSAPPDPRSPPGAGRFGRPPACFRGEWRYRQSFIKVLHPVSFLSCAVVLFLWESLLSLSLQESLKHFHLHKFGNTLVVWIVNGFFFYSSPSSSSFLSFLFQIRKRQSSSSMIEDRFAASAREYVESLHQNSRTHLLYGKNNVLVQPVPLLILFVCLFTGTKLSYPIRVFWGFF